MYKCGHEKTPENTTSVYSRVRGKRYGPYAECTICRKAYMKVYRSEHNFTEYMKTWRAKNSERVAAIEAKKRSTPEYKNYQAAYSRAYRLLSDTAIEKEIDRNAKRREKRVATR